MANAKASTEGESLQSHVESATADVLTEAAHLRLVVESVEATVAEVLGDDPAPKLRQAAAVMRTHLLGLLLSVARLTSRAELLETLAELREVAGRQGSDIAS